ncbi:hypothetical protein KFK09_002659 [Dendrobium nobile]|uniref:ARM repeat superfamily protein n=1 Tax=Dendrobium nobile TaxID=94219 RepID=A0A8T3C7V9_DENNO|nr:hypothetical protein KFK09_002659 [Dendrobium nobile]
MRVSHGLIFVSVGSFALRTAGFQQLDFNRSVIDERRIKVAEMGGAQDLLIMLETAKDDKTRKEALKALLALSHSDAVAEILQQANAAAIVASAPDSSEFDEIGNCKSSLLKRFKVFEDNQSPSEVAFT